MYEKGIGRIPDAVLHARFVRALPNEYSLVKETLQAMRNRDRDEIIRMVSTRHSNLPQKKGTQRSSRQPEQAFVSSESGRRSGARGGRDRRGGGRQGRGLGGSSCGGVGNITSSGTSSGSTGSIVGTQGSSDGAGSLGGSGDGRHHIPSGRCFRCRQRGHRKQDCTTRRASSYPGAPGTQVLATKRVPAHRTRRYWWWSYRYPKKTSPWKLRRSRQPKQARAVRRLTIE